jgi:hypothetical protein
MENNKILKIFKNFAGKRLNIQGLIVIPVKVEPNGLKNKRLNMYFNVFNPNDISYFSPIVEGYLYDETEEFGDYINEKIDVYFANYSQEGIFLNKELTSKIQKVFDSVDTIKFFTGTPFVGYQRYVLHIRSVGVSTDYWDVDSFHILNNVKVISAEKNGEPWDPKIVSEIYIKEFLSYKEKYYETEEYYKQIDTILNGYPLFDDQYGNTAGYYDTKFVS